MTDRFVIQPDGSLRQKPDPPNTRPLGHREGPCPECRQWACQSTPCTVAADKLRYFARLVDHVREVNDECHELALKVRAGGTQADLEALDDARDRFTVACEYLAQVREETLPGYLAHRAERRAEEQREARAAIQAAASGRAVPEGWSVRSGREPEGRCCSCGFAGARLRKPGCWRHDGCPIRGGHA